MRKDVSKYIFPSRVALTTGGSISKAVSTQVNRGMSDPFFDKGIEAVHYQLEENMVNVLINILIKLLD